MRQALLIASLAVAVAAAATANLPTYISQLQPCPQRCAEVGANSANWTVYGNFFEETFLCESTLLLDFAVHNPLDDPAKVTKISACDAGDGGIGIAQMPPSQPLRRRSEQASRDSCEGTAQKADFVLKFSASNSQHPHKDISGVGSIAKAAQKLQTRLRDPNNCNVNIAFAKSGSAVVGAYVGPSISKQSAVDALVQKFISSAGTSGGMAQFCGSSSDYAIGIIGNTNGDLVAVQQAVKSWSQAECVKASSSETAWPKVTLDVNGQPFPPNNNEPLPRSNSTSTAASATASAGSSTAVTSTTEASDSATTTPIAGSNPTHSSVGSGNSLQKRDICWPVQAVHDDTCWLLSQKCKIDLKTFQSLNPKFPCGNVPIGAWACCTKGDLPDMRPKPNADGTCKSYKVAHDDTCFSIGGANGLTVDDLEKLNKNTWGWYGCDPGKLFYDTIICLSPGRPPMPMPVSNTICGPQVPGTKPPPAGKNLADLNPCPLKACCNIWGQCGTTNEFCTASPGPRGAPGTSGVPNGCISNCGTNWVLDKSPTANFMKVAYFEAWNDERPCLRMNVKKIDKTKYTHIHYSFGGITSDYQVDISKVQKQWNGFKGLTGIKKILSFGGWSFSTKMDTYPIFRQGVTDANRQKFATSVANFVVSEGLDGVDFDWEYPGAPDIRGDDGPLPPGSKEDGANYLKFLKMVRAALPTGKSVSIAAPASYWYLRGFDPVDQFAKAIDYMIFMTYDLHGQWDFGAQWSSSGCPAGNCLRSHVNLTETMNALAMVTRAGMPSSKVIVGVTSYGRSFGMTNAGCVGPMCTYGGPQSTATKGRCTDTAGYISNFEINEIIKSGKGKTWYDPNSGSDIMTYGNNWVAYMSDKTKKDRTTLYQLNNFGGVSDWAVDLQDDVGSDPPVDVMPLLWDVPNCDERSYKTLDDLAKDAFAKGYPTCMNQWIIQALDAELRQALKDYDDLINHQYDKKFGYYVEYVRDNVPDSIAMDNYVRGNIDAHWKCTHQKSKVMCCPKDGGGSGNAGCDRSPDCNNNPIVEPWGCPYGKDDNHQDPGDAGIWLIQNDDQKNIEADILKKTGALPSWWHYGDKDLPGVGCGFCFHPAHGWPSMNTRQNIGVPNPKDQIAKALDNYRELSNQLRANFIANRYGLNTALSSDVITAAELAVSMAMESVESMKQVAEIGKEEEKRDQQEMINAFILAFLLVVPMIGELADTVGAPVALVNFITIAGEAGNIGAGIYEIMQDPNNAWAAILGMISPVKLKSGNSGKAWEDAANIRRGMKAQDFDALPQRIKDRSAKVNKLKVCGI